jgi:chemotaxis protein MotB
MIEEDPPPGVPEWVVTYGDMMSLLLTFFIMLVSLSELKGDKKYQTMVESIMRHMGYTTGPNVTPGDNFALNSAIQKLKTMGAQIKKGEGKGGVKTAGPAAEELRVMKGREGTPISLGGALVFAPGRAEPSPEAVAAVAQLALKLAGKPHKVEIRGHTGRGPLPADSGFEDEYALAYARARAVYNLLAEQGISPDRMRIASSADTEPISGGADSEPKYIDRVDLFVLDAYSRDFVGGRPVGR